MAGGMFVMVGSVFIMAAVAVLEPCADFDRHLRANTALNIGDSMGAILYVADPELMACAQTRHRGQSSLKCKLDM